MGIPLKTENDGSSMVPSTGQTSDAPIPNNTTNDNNTSAQTQGNQGTNNIGALFGAGSESGGSEGSQILRMLCNTNEKKQEPQLILQNVSIWDTC